MSNKTYTREELYNLIWVKPMTTVAKELEVPYNQLIKVCVSYNIPAPKAGHWQKVEYRKKVEILQLPDLKEGQSNEISFQKTIKEKEKKIINEVNIIKAFIVPDRLTKPDPRILSVKEELINSKWEYHGLVHAPINELNIKVSKLNIARALRIFDTLIKSFKYLNHEIFVSQSQTYVLINDIKIHFGIRERLAKIVPSEANRYNNLKPTGKLSVKIDKSYYQKEFVDGSKETVEQMLPKIIAHFISFAEKEAIWKEECKIAAQERNRIEQIRKDYENRREKDLINFNDTLLKSSRWHKANNLRMYINEVENRNQGNEEIKDWIQWARSKANWYDPFMETEDELFKDIDQNTLQLKKNKSVW